MSDFTIDLKKNLGESLGIGFRKLTNPPHCEVSRLVEDGVALKSGLIHEGDMLLGINGINVQHLSPSEVGGVLARNSTESVITLELRRDEASDDSTGETIDHKEHPVQNGHPTIVVEAFSPHVSPDCITPVSNGSPEINMPLVIGWKGNRLGRLRRENPIGGQTGVLPEIQEDKTIPSTMNLNVQVQAVHRHSLTPQSVTKPIEDLDRAGTLRSSKSLDLANLPQWRSGSITKNVTVHNLLDGSEMSDRLHNKGIKVCREHEELVVNLGLPRCVSGLITEITVWLCCLSHAAGQVAQASS